MIAVDNTMTIEKETEQITADKSILRNINF